MAAALVLLLVGLGALAAGVLIGRYYVPDDRQLRRTARHSRAYMRALSHLVARDHETAISELRTVVEENVEDVEPYFALGAMFRSRGEHERAIRVHQALALREQGRRKLKQRAMYELGLDFRAAGMPRRATRALEEVLLEEPGHEGALRVLAALYEEQARFNEAAGLWQRLGKRRGEDTTPREHHLLVAAAQAALARDDLDAARQLLKSAQKHAESSHFLVAAAELAAARGNHQGAKERLKQALIAEPALAPHVLPGLIAAEQGLTGAAAGRADDELLDDVETLPLHDDATTLPLPAGARPALPAHAALALGDGGAGDSAAPTDATSMPPAPGGAAAMPAPGAATSEQARADAASAAPGAALAAQSSPAAMPSALGAAPVARGAAMSAHSGAVPVAPGAAMSAHSGAAPIVPGAAMSAHSGAAPVVPGAAMSGHSDAAPVVPGAGMPAQATIGAAPGAAPEVAAQATALSATGVTMLPMAHLTAQPAGMAPTASELAATAQELRATLVAGASREPDATVALVPEQRPALPVTERVLATLAEVEAATGPRLELALIRAQLLPAGDAAALEAQARELAAAFPTSLAARVAAARLALRSRDGAAVRDALDGLVAEGGALAWALRGRWQCAHCGHRPGAFSWRCSQCRRWNTLRMETGIEPPPPAPRERRAAPRTRPDGLLGARDEALPVATLEGGVSDAELASPAPRASLLGRVGGWVSGVWRRGAT